MSRAEPGHTTGNHTPGDLSGIECYMNQLIVCRVVANPFENPFEYEYPEGETKRMAKTRPIP